MNNSDLLRYKNLLLSKRQELSTGKSLVDSISAAGELRGDPVDMATGETDAATQIRLHQTDGKLLRAIDDALTRIRHEEFGICAECGRAHQQGAIGSGALDQVVQGLQGTAGLSKLRRWQGISHASPPAAMPCSQDGYGGAGVFLRRGRCPGSPRLEQVASAKVVLLTVMPHKAGRMPRSRTRSSRIMPRRTGPKTRSSLRTTLPHQNHREA